MTAYLFTQYQIKTEPPPAFLKTVPVMTQWHAPFSEPKRFMRGLATHLQQLPAPSNPIQPSQSNFGLLSWMRALGEPRRFKAGLRADEQQFLAYHPRLLPRPNVTITLASRETNADIALIGIVVYNTVASTGADRVSVSITEIPAEEGAQTSVEEIE